MFLHYRFHVAVYCQPRRYANVTVNALKLWFVIFSKSGYPRIVTSGTAQRLDEVAPRQAIVQMKDFKIHYAPLISILADSASIVNVLNTSAKEAMDSNSRG